MSLFGYFWIAAALLVLLSCHDAPRNNPFDPALTPAVELSVALDDTAGTATLTWSRYEGQQPFREYQVLRNLPDSKKVDTLTHIPTVAQVAFVDTTLAPNTGYVYRVETLNAGGYAAPSEERGVTGYAAGPVVLVAVEVDAQQGQAQLRWTHFTGARFEGYQVERRNAGEDSFAVIQKIAGLSDTAWVDEDLTPEISYVYRIVVEAAGQPWPSTPSSRQSFSLAPVQLLPEPINRMIDPELGTLTLVWGRFRGPDFRAYQMCRRVSGTSADQEEVLKELTGVQDTTFVDETLRAGVLYAYRVIVQAAGQALPSSSLDYRMPFPPVRILGADFQSTTASATLRWTPYVGARFRAYQVLRRTAELASQVVAEIPDRAVRSYVDTGLVGNTEYFYKVAVLTTRDEEVESAEISGSFHDLVATWPLDLEEGEYVRLYREGEKITALVAGAHRVRLVFFDSGGPVGEQVLWDVPDIPIEPRAAATYLSPAGSRALSLMSAGDLFLLRFGPEGGPVWREYPVFVDSLSILSGEERRIKGQIRLSGNAIYDDVRVTSRGEVLFADDFEGEDLAERWSSFIGAEVANGRLTLLPSGSATKEEALWQDFRLEATLTLLPQGLTGAILIGDYIVRASSFSSFSLTLNSQAQTIQLRWHFRPPENSGLKNESQVFTESFPVFPGIPYRLGLEFVEGKVSVSIQSPIIWSGARDPSSPWACLAGIEEKLLLVSGSQSYRINLGETDSDSIKSTLVASPSEMRTWGRQSTGNTQRWIGICLPERQRVFTNQTVVSKATGRITWPFGSFASATALGAEVGQEPGNFLFPLSFDGSADRRIYVLDAGNARIQVFDIEGKYLTQWGRRGSGEGEFNFGGGRVPEDFVGSVAVDGEGYIYVADVGNRRIEKFAP